MKTREQQNWEKALQLHIYRLRNELLGIEGGNLAQVREPEAQELRYRIAVAEAELAGLDAPPPPPVEDDLSETPVANGLAEGTNIDTVFVPVEGAHTTPMVPANINDYESYDDEDWREFWEDGTAPASENDSSEPD